MALSVGFISLRFLHGCDPSYRALTFALMGLTPIEHASLRWTHCSAKILCEALLAHERFYKLCDPAAHAQNSLEGDADSLWRDRSEVFAGDKEQFLIPWVGHDIIEVLVGSIVYSVDPHLRTPYVYPIST